MFGHMFFALGVVELVWGFWGFFLDTNPNPSPSVAARLISGIMFMVVSFLCYSSARRKQRHGVEEPAQVAQTPLSASPQVSQIPPPDAADQNIAELKQHIDDLVRRAEGGECEAQNELGLRFKAGPKDYTEAERWYRKAAAQGYAPARINLGHLFFEGLGVAQNYTEAVRWYREAGEQGCFALASMYENGKGVAKNSVEAIRLYRKAAESGSPDAQYRLGNFYFMGKEVARDCTEAVRWYRKAAGQGFQNAQFLLASLYRSGDGVVKDETKAAQWYRCAAEQGNSSAMVNLGCLYREGIGVPQDYAEAMKLYRRAAEKGLDAAMHNVAVMYRDGVGVTQDHTEALRWYREAAEKGYGPALSALAVMFRSGYGVHQDDDEAYFWFHLVSTWPRAGDVSETWQQWRDEMAAKLTPSKLAVIQGRTRQWGETHPPIHG